MPTQKYTVHILVSVPDLRRLDACTLCFDTLRVGWPTAQLRVTVNCFGSPSEMDAVAASIRARCPTAKVSEATLQWHLADWIEDVLFHAEGPTVILDADTIFWKSCEDWAFPMETLLAGYYVPKIWNDFSQCISYPRIHTSCMVFPDPAKLHQQVNKLYPWSSRAGGEYCPCRPFMSDVKFINGRPCFWDCGANLYAMLSTAGDQVAHFEWRHLECFDHLNSASFYDVMNDRLTDNRMFQVAHNEWVKEPQKLRNLWPSVNLYYKLKQIEGDIHEAKV